MKIKCSEVKTGKFLHVCGIAVMLPKSSTWQQNRLCSLKKTSWTDLVRKGLDFVARASLMFILVRREGLSYLTQLKKDAEKPTSVALCFCPRHEMLSSLFL